MRYICMFIVSISIIMSVFAFDSYEDGINYISDKLDNISSALSIVGSSENVENFRQHPLVNYKFTSIGMYGVGDNVIPIGMFIANNILPTYLTSGNYSNLFTSEVLVSPYAYSFTYKYRDTAIKPSGVVRKSYSFDNCIRVKVKIFDNTNNKDYIYNIYITNEDMNGRSIPTYFVNIDDKVYVSNKFNDFWDFYDALKSGDTDNLLNLDYISNGEQIRDLYNIYNLTEEQTQIVDIFSPFYDYFTRFNNN